MSGGDEIVRRDRGEEEAALSADLPLPAGVVSAPVGAVCYGWDRPVA